MTSKSDYLMSEQYDGIEKEKSFLGIMPSPEVPIDVVGIHLLGNVFDDFQLLIADEFLKINGYNEYDMFDARTELELHLHLLDMIYGPCPRFFCSQFMDSDEYLEVFGEVVVSLDKKTKEMLSETVPEKHREKGIKYPLNELACVKYLSERGFGFKIGPGKERAYDRIMEGLGFDMKFAYLRPCYTLGTKEPETVIPYSPHSRGSGQRIFLSDSKNTVKSKLLMGPEEADRYFCRLGSLAGIILGNPYLDLEEIELLYGKRLKKKTVKLIFENIVEPVQLKYTDLVI